jgi:hypothetical protein
MSRNSNDGKGVVQDSSIGAVAAPRGVIHRDRLSPETTCGLDAAKATSSVDPL